MDPWQESPDAWQRHGAPWRPYRTPEIAGPFLVLTIRTRRPSHHWLRYTVLARKHHPIFHPVSQHRRRR